MNARGRERGSLKEAKKIGLWFEANADARLTDMAAAAGTSRSALAQWLIETAEKDTEGRPAGWAAAHPREGGIASRPQIKKNPRPWPGGDSEA